LLRAGAAGGSGRPDGVPERDPERDPGGGQEVRGGGPGASRGARGGARHLPPGLRLLPPSRALERRIDSLGRRSVYSRPVPTHALLRGPRPMPSGDITRLLVSIRDGDPDALNALLPLVYAEL